jgi:glyoxylase-like metal-dependent hydrolase (beta-lactamase superfamily II)
MKAERVAPDVFRLRTMMVNVYFVRDGASGDWVLVDTGMPGFARTIRREAERLFGGRPRAIVLTHGHFDHVGAVGRLSSDWGIPVYAHPLELPYLTGRSKYPPPDPTVGGGTQSLMSPLYSRGPVDLGSRIHMLPMGGAVPGLPEWQWLLTCGHAPGHVSLFRDVDRTLIAGDAVVTTRQESTTGALLQRPTLVWRPPAYFTPDWQSARRSVETLAALDPETLVTGHGRPMRGATMRRQLRDLADRFDKYMPASGRYVPYPAVADERGVVHVPPRPGIAMTRGTIAAAVGAAAIGAGLIALARRRSAQPGG